MPILKRDDGMQFAIHTYRELLEPVKTSLLKTEVRMLAQNHGEYIRLFKQPNGQTEAIFSRDPGYLLGEAVGEYFGKPSDLIYCEALPEGQYAIVVVIRSGTIYLDSRIPISSIPDEFTSLVTGYNRYQIYIYGNIPLSEIKEPGKFCFDNSLVESFTRLPQPIFKNLPVVDSLQLLPLEFALHSEKIIPRSTLFFTSILGVLLLIIFWWHHSSQVQSTAVTPLTVTETPTNPYQNYNAALMSPAPEQQLHALVKMLNLVYGLPGWHPAGATWDGVTYKIMLNSRGGTFLWLSQWAHNRNIPMTLTAQGITLSPTVTLANRPKPEGIYSADEVVEAIIDKANRVLPQRSITFGNTSIYSVYKTTDLTLQFNQISPEVLILIGKQFTHLPVKLSSAQWAINDVGLLSGTIQFTVLGN